MKDDNSFDELIRMLLKNRNYYFFFPFFFFDSSIRPVYN